MWGTTGDGSHGSYIVYLYLSISHIYSTRSAWLLGLFDSLPLILLQNARRLTGSIRGAGAGPNNQSGNRSRAYRMYIVHVIFPPPFAIPRAKDSFFDESLEGILCLQASSPREASRATPAVWARRPNRS